MREITLFIIGFPLLVKGADFLIGGSSAFAKRFNVPDIVIGLTIIAMGTSAPELFVNILGSVKGTADIAIGNILGSNIFNIFIVLGISALISALSAERRTTRKEVPLNLLAVIILAVLANEALMAKAGHSYLTRPEGFLMLGIFLAFFLYLFRSAFAAREHAHAEPIKQHGLPKAFLLMAFGLAGLLLGAEWIVTGAVFIAKKLGLSEFLISSTIIAGGTSLPELAASTSAISKGKSGIAVGNVMGSNIFNILFVLGISAVIRPLPIAKSINIDIGAAFLASVLLLAAMLVNRKRILLAQWQGACFVLFYAAYVAFLIMRG